MSFILQPAAAGAGTNFAIASGAIPNGIAVVMNSDGTVSAVSPTGGTNSILFSSGVNFTSSNGVSSNCLASVYDPVNKKIVILYSNATDGTNCVVGTVSGSTITFGSIVNVSASQAVLLSGCYHTANGTCVFASQLVGGGFVFVVSVSGTTPTVTTSSGSFSAGTPYFISICYDSLASKCLIVFRDAGVSNYGTAVVATVSGTTVSFGARAIYGIETVTGNSVVYDTTDQKSIISYTANSTALRILTATIIGTTPSYGTAQTISSANISAVSSAYDSVNNKTVVIFTDGTALSKLYSSVVTVSGTNVSLGASNVVSTLVSVQYSTIVYNSAIGKFDISYSGVGNAYAYAIIGTIIGSTLTIGSETQVNSIASGTTIGCYDANSQKYVLTLSNPGGYGIAYVGSPGSNLSASNFFGISLASYTNGQTAAINTIGGLNSSQSGLTPGTTYYVQADGTLGTSPGSISVIAGQAKSATSLIVKS